MIQSACSIRSNFKHGIVFFFLFCGVSSYTVQVVENATDYLDPPDTITEFEGEDYVLGDFGVGDEHGVNIIKHSINRINSTLFKSVKRYHCTVGMENTYLLVYGTKSWTFPTQDVNLTLSYPPENEQNREGSGQSYIITDIEVVLYIDGTESKGFVTAGGILHTSISLAFLMPNVSTVSYEFYLYGVTADDTEELQERYSSFNLC